MDSYRSATAGSPADLLAQMKALGLGGGKSPNTYAALASKQPLRVGRQEGRPSKEQRAAPTSAFFNQDLPTADLLAKVASLVKQTAGPRTTPSVSQRSTPEDLFSRVQRSPSALQRPASVATEDAGSSSSSILARPGSLDSRQPVTTPLISIGLPRGLAHSASASGEPTPASSRRHTSDGTGPSQHMPPPLQRPKDAADSCVEPPAWSEELLNWMLAEKSELLLEVQRAQRRQQELQQELDRARARAGQGVEEEVQRLKVERRMLLERIQRLSQQDADSSALLERVQMENDALSTELERSQEVCKEMLAARRAARDALSEMSAQNARLVSAYVEKKQEAAQLREEMRTQQQEAEARVTTLQAELQAAQAQCLELHSQLQAASSHSLAHSPELGASPLQSSARRPAAAELPGRSQSPPYSAGGSPDFGTNFFTPAHHRTPPSIPQAAQQQGGKENTSWSGNLGTSPAACRKPASGQGAEARESPLPLGQGGGSTQGQARGEWDKERSELLTLLERLQRQLSAHAELQASPARQGPSPEPHPQAQAGLQQHPSSDPSPARFQAPGQSDGTAPGLWTSPFATGSTLQSPLHDLQLSSPTTTPPTHHAASSSGPTPRHSHFSVPHHSRSSQPGSGAAGGPGVGGPADETVLGSAGGSQRSCQTGAAAAAGPHHSRRTSGVNLSRAFESACGRSGGGIGGRKSGSSERSGRRESSGYDGSCGKASGDANRSSMRSEASGWHSGSCQEEEEEEEEGYTYSGAHGYRPPSISDGVPSPSSCLSSLSVTPPAMPTSPRLEPSPIVPPMATPFAAQPSDDARSESPSQLQRRQHQGLASVPAPPAQHDGSPEDQRLADVERRNAALEAEVQRLRQLQQESEERQKQEELRARIDQHKQAGNAAFQQQRYEQSVQEYTAGLELLAAEPSNASASAVLYCNRAAALHAMGRYLDAVADCFRAEQRDPAYARLYHRRADAYCAMGAYDDASQDLDHLVDVGCGREVAARLAEVQHKLKAQYPVNHYVVLGVKPTATAAEIKSAYRALALKFHPDKAGQALPHDAAGAIFKLVTAANAALSDSERRRTHDLQMLRHKYRRFYSYHL